MRNSLLTLILILFKSNIITQTEKTTYKAVADKLRLPRFMSARTGLELNGKKLARGDTSHGERIFSVWAF